jgi:hypothetical protein
MNRAQLVKMAREDYLDDVNDAADPEPLYRWSTRFLIRSLGEAERVACRSGSCRLIYDETTDETCTITLVAGTQSYAISPKVTRIERIMYDGDVLERVTPQDLDERVTGWRDYDAGPPGCCYVIGRMLYLDRAPSSSEADDKITLHVWREPLAPPLDNEEPEIPSVYHEDLIHYMVYRAKLKRGEETYDPDGAKMALAQFQSRFGQENSVDVLERRLESPGFLQHHMGSTAYADLYRKKMTDWLRDL